MTWKDFRDAVYKVPAEERKDCCWFLNETVLNHIANIEDTSGRPIWRRPTDAMPGKLDLYPYHEVSILPQIADIKADQPFAVFMNPRRIQLATRRAWKIKRFDQTTESMEYGELFLRFHKRDGFLVGVAPALDSGAKFRVAQPRPPAMEELRAHPAQLLPDDGAGVYLCLSEKILNGL